MLVHLAALARAARREDRASQEDRELLAELEALLGLILVDATAGTLTAAALSLAPAAVATLATANTFFDSAERLSLRQASRDHAAAVGAAEMVPTRDKAEPARQIVSSLARTARTTRPDA